jgi:hypothetical protein
MTETNNPPFDSKLPPMCNAWIFLNDDYPEGTNYNSPNSMYQDLISKKVYEAMDIINLVLLILFQRVKTRFLQEMAVVTPCHLITFLTK